ncbi:biopolymer transporter ExbD [Burkholderia pseudomallei]|uniref:ExbD/TolR family protein n=1 Tax=Burkholderia pseudomallei TaxID=28450 RepID=UPI001AD7049B|nr:biopolymer transporter ExbD [Burkholderia pseudomallei]MBO7844376.1 biopolymer transporter ExbD [Burkholderia pseudomallei]
MAFGGLDHQHTSQPMADINMTPLIDVMLVLLVIFIITAPLLTHAIRLDLPKVAAAPARETPETITVSIDAAGKLYWNDAPDALAARLRDVAAAGQDPELHLRAARDTRYDTIAQVMGAAQQAGVARIGFVTDAPAPPARPSPPRGAPPSLSPPASPQAQPQPPSPPPSPAASR